MVEPKKAGRSFGDIINGINSNATPVMNQNVFARQPNPFSTEKSSIKSQPATVLNYKLSELTGEGDKKKENEHQLETARIKAAAATAQAARERKKLEALQEKKRVEAELKEARRIEAEKLKLEQQIREELQMKEERIKQLEREREEQIHRQETLRKEQREKQIAAMHLNVVKSQLAKRLLDEVLHQVIEEEISVSAIKAVKSRRLLKRTALPWLARARAAIIKRQDKAMHRKRKWNFNMFIVTHNPYVSSDDTIYKVKPLHSTTEGVKKRVHQSLQAEKMILENTDPVS